MKYIKTFESHRSLKYETINEEFFGLNKLIGNLFKKAKAYINKIKGGQEIETIYKKYITIINNEFNSQAKVELNIVAASELGEGKPPVTPNGGTSSSPGSTSSVPESNNNSYNSFKLIKEADEDIDVKTNVQNLKSKKTILEQIIKKNKEAALKEMDAVLKKYGGSASNPQLAIIIDTKKNQFDLDFLNAQINYLEKSGDKTAVNEYIKQRDAIAKNIENSMKNIETAKPIEIKAGEKYIYKRKIFDTDPKNKEEWEKAGDEKFNIESEVFKNLNSQEKIGCAKVKSIDNDKIIFESETEGETFEIPKNNILGKAVIKQENVDKNKVEGQEELIANLKTVKDKNPEGIKTMNTISTLLTDPEANKEKINQINQILGGENQNK